ncbi:glycosyltransferase family 2 protein [Cruoricaptor ignavus]|uniref:glycosyltransferase family 2 protein n=1 Tax=Cruoricaptor ignavus TaxID=1118202 RepID=UPI00370D28C7
MNISVIIPVYNAERFLEKAVASALQFPEVKEVLLVEDGSPDNSLEVCRNLLNKDKRIKLFQHPDKQNHGAGATRNLGLQKASQEFIAFLDADDYYLPNRFDAEREIFKNENIDGVFGAIGTEFLTEKGREEFHQKFGQIQLTTVKKQAEGKEVFFGLLGLDNSFGTFFSLIGLTIRKTALEKCGLKFNRKLRVHQDRDFIIKLSYCAHLKSGNITEAVAIRGVHDDNRITKIPIYSQNYNERQFLLWNSLHEWSLDKAMPMQYSEHIRLKKTAFELALQKPIHKYINFAREILRNKDILKTRYRFTFLKR